MKAKDHTLDPGSFKDPDGKVFFCGLRVMRELAPTAVLRAQQLLKEPFINELMSQGALPKTWFTDEATLEHERIQPISYAYEWPFSMLRDAALLTLQVQEII